MRRLCTVCFVAFLLPGQLSADPVEALREELGRPVQPIRSPEMQRARVKRLEALVSKVRSVPDLLRAAALLTADEANRGGAPPLPGTFPEGLRAQLGDRLVETVRRELARPESRERRLAVLALLRHSALQDRSRQLQPVSAPLAKDLHALANRSDDPELRLAALRTLVVLDPDVRNLTKALSRSLASKTVPERQQAASLLLALLPNVLDGAPPAGIRGPAVDDPVQRILAVVPLAREGMRDGDPLVRQRCLAVVTRACQKLNGPAAQSAPDLNEPLREITRTLPAVADLLEDRDLETSLAAHLALEKAASLRLILASSNAATPPPPPSEKDREPEQKGKERKVIEGGRPGTNDGELEGEPLAAGLRKAVPALTRNLGHKEIRVRLAALYVLETLTVDATPAAEPLAKLLEDDNRFVRWGAARALRNVAPAGATKVIPALADALSDDSPDVRQTAAAALARCGGKAKAALDALTKALGRKDEVLRLHAARALGAIGTEAKPAREALVKLLRDEKPEVRSAAAAALGRTGPLDAKTKKALVAALEDEDEQVQSAAANALLVK